MSLTAWFEFNAHGVKPGPFDHPGHQGDTIDFPDVLVTEEPADADTLRRFYTAEERKALELIP